MDRYRKMERGKMLSIDETKKLWQSLATKLVIPRDEASYQYLVDWLDKLIDEVGENEQHPLASLMDILGVVIEQYETDRVPELQY
jgi:HTH-type transcriptional regulator/antitoxin HigA